MKTAISEIRVRRDNPMSSNNPFVATLRDGKLHSIEPMRNLPFGRMQYKMPTVETVKAYIQFLQEVIGEMEES